MRIMLVEDDYYERCFACEDLIRAFGQLEIVEIRTAGHFLTTVAEMPPDLRGIEVIVMEHFLPLVEIGESQEALEADIQNLNLKFPDVVKDWHHQLAGERLLRWLREKGVQVPVVIYTHSDRDMIAVDVRVDPKVFYCEKGVEQTVLHAAVRCALAGKNQPAQ